MTPNLFHIGTAINCGHIQLTQFDRQLWTAIVKYIRHGTFEPVKVANSSIDNVGLAMAILVYRHKEKLSEIYPHIIIDKEKENG